MAMVEQAKVVNIGDERTLGPGGDDRLNDDLAEPARRRPSLLAGWPFFYRSLESAEAGLQARRGCIASVFDPYVANVSSP
jgi:hypothetical protein